MKYTLIIRPEAGNDIASAYSWYELQSKGLGSNFILCIDACLWAIQRTPQLYQKIYKTIRRALTRRFPYEIFYIVKGKKIIVLAVLHAKRNQIHWQNRYSNN